VQALEHENTAEPSIVAGVNTNELADIGFGFHNSTANAYLHAQLADGVRVQLTSYLSGRHHNETWVKNYLVDAFTTEIGGEVYLRSKGLILMGAVTGGELRGTVLTPGQRGPTYIGKGGFDRKVRPDLRVRMTGSIYTSDKAMSSTLYGGNRAGSRYYYVMGTRRRRAYRSY
jgi:hypothetical protein